jgi:queuine tRNA-ribosyltransferase
MILSQINLAYYQELMGGMRNAIEEHAFDAYCASVREGWAKGDLPALE